MVTVIVIAAAVALLAAAAGWVISTYNSLVQARNKTDYTWAQVDVILKKRFDLVPGLVETVRGYAAHEKETLAKVIEARSRITTAGSVSETADANNMLTGALRSLFAVAEAYPDLKANAGFISLQEELTNIENKIAYQRQFYNDSVYAFNTRIQQFPTVIVARIFGFGAKDLFNTEQAEEREPVKFSFRDTP
ncbi:MAG: LemA family protein [Abditibacteriota bacterium]|nr:LemA family protein [Abditibacteriota bacterium]